MTSRDRFPLRRGFFGNLILLAFFFAPRSRCYAERDDRLLTLRIGWAVIRIALDDVASVERRSTGAGYQFGRTWKTEIAEELMLAYGAGDHIVVRLERPVRVLVLPYPAVSFALEDTDAFLAALAAARGGRQAARQAPGLRNESFDI